MCLIITPSRSVLRLIPQLLIKPCKIYARFIALVNSQQMHSLKSPTFKFQNRSLGHPAPKGILAEKLHMIISCPSFVLEGNSRVGVV